MKIWGVLCLFWISGLNAHNIGGADKFDGSEERAGVGVPTHFDEESNTQTSSKDHKAESSSLRDNRETLISSKEEIEKPEPYMIIVNDKLSPPGGGFPTLDPKVINEMILPPFPEAELPWWERWWSEVNTWFFGDNS